MLSKRYESTEVDRRTWLQVSSVTTHQVVEVKCEYLIHVYEGSVCHRLKI